ncbi:ABC transporter [Fusarium tjaetaba]|uniref:ABC transporter n=1 Tax=Fusarium tjaetaba TaxID=1567544 RepID=A0A8H5VEI4_9HYPO|nr:ABC transporter [Fusarium tjaetaba]KAF5621617.1 ABC transporter [Fusarium tjaetaba]
MTFIKQVGTLMGKNFRILLMRHLALCIWMAFILPIFLAALFSFTKNLLVPPAEYGIGKPTPLIDLGDAIKKASNSGRKKLVLVNNNFTEGNIGRVFSTVTQQFQDAAESADVNFEVISIEREQDLRAECPSNLRGLTRCFGAVVMLSSPDQGPGGLWNYTIRADGDFGRAGRKFEISKSNDQQIYVIPLQHSVDRAISLANSSSTNELNGTQEYPYTTLTPEERDREIRTRFQKVIRDWMGVAFLGTVVWITYHLTGFIATERESGMSTLIDAMMPIRKPWLAMVARIIAHHISFSLIYLPAWIIGSIIVRGGVFAKTSVGIVLVFHVLIGLAFSSISMLFASFFRKAQLSGITAILVVALLGILSQVLSSPGTVSVAVLSIFFTPCAFVFFISNMAWFEEQEMPTDLLKAAPNSPSKLPGIVIWIFLIIQIFAYPLIGAFIEHALYSNDTPGRKILHNQTDVDRIGSNAVQLRQFSKTYKPSIFSRLFRRGPNKKPPVLAVNGLDLDIGQGQIVALLGANGSGKSTTLDAIAGMNKLTSGSIKIDGRGGLGIAPQKNVLWDDLTVEEHIRIFNHLKAPNARATTQEIEDLIRSVDLYKKRKAFAKTLSGGQKRKLQLGLMLTGGSAVCCVDEVSSGIDPLSRRKLWDIILAERGRRTMILTTHFLDEADLLADHIAILSKGTLRAEGSSVALKDNMGGGYRVHVPKDIGIRETPDIDQVAKKDAFDLITYTAPTSQLAAVVIKSLEAAGIKEYRFSGPTIEDVFLQVAEEIRDEEAFRNANHPLSVPSSEKVASKEKEGENPGLALTNGQRVGYLKQSLILFRKRLTILKRNRFLYLLAFLLPIFAGGLTSLFIINESTASCVPGDQSRKAAAQGLNVFDPREGGDNIALRLLAGPRSKLSTDLFRLINPMLKGNAGSETQRGFDINDLSLVDTFQQFKDKIETDRKNITGGIWLGNDEQGPTFAWVANLAIVVPIFAQQMLDVVMSNVSIATSWAPFELPVNDTTGSSLQMIVYMSIALSVYPAFFALYPSNERRKFIRGLQYSNGVRPLPLWIAYLLFDLIIVLVSTAIVVAIWAGVSDIWFNIGYVFLVLFLYGIASTVFAYLVSLFTKTQLGTYAWAAASQTLILVVYIIAYMSVLTYSPVTKVDSSLRLVHFVISAFAPIGSALKALFISTNLFSTACDGNSLTENPSGILYYGGPILYLILQSLIFFGLLIWLDTGTAGASLRGLFRGGDKAESDEEHVDEDIIDEREKVTRNEGHEHGLRIMHLTKSFRDNIAVDNVTFGIKRGEVFALLGPNGAGKSTTISLIRGDIKPDRNGGDVLVEDISVSKNLAGARANLGVCPQFDAMDQMTVREHLEFYAKIRGVTDIEHNVRAVMQAVGLESFSTRMAHALSGGNKRKLSLGIALMGNPTVVLLDEPSSGLDAASKRVMWRTLEATIPGRSILLTTHSMEEADALAGRAGILARRMLALGTPDNLRHRFGDALHIHLVAKSAPRTTQEEMDRMTNWIRQTLPSADVDEKTYHGQIRFSVRAGQVLAATSGRKEEEISSDREVDLSQSAIGHLVVLLEENKAELGVGHYSVMPTTLDQVFLTIVGQHNVKEENSEEKKQSIWRKIWMFGRS